MVMSMSMSVGVSAVSVATATSNVVPRVAPVAVVGTALRAATFVARACAKVAGRRCKAGSAIGFALGSSFTLIGLLVALLLVLL